MYVDWATLSLYAMNDANYAQAVHGVPARTGEKQRQRLRGGQREMSAH
jgi:hypothetical protein